MMKKLLIALMTLGSISSFSQKLEDATLSELKVLTQYLSSTCGEDKILDCLDDDEFSSQSFVYEGYQYSLIIVYSGDTPHGPIYRTVTGEIVGSMSDGSVTINGKDIEFKDTYSSDFFYTKGREKGERVIALYNVNSSTCYRGDGWKTRKALLDYFNNDIEVMKVSVWYDQTTKNLKLSYVSTKCLDDSLDATEASCRETSLIKSCN